MVVHPRWRGEHVLFLTGGKCCLRFIPAGAGNTISVPRSAFSLTVYPRWRGEHYALAAALMYAAGLSPLARGTLNYLNTGKTPDRFIPAGAGNTIQCPTHPSKYSVYPRWRGEHG